MKPYFINEAVDQAINDYLSSNNSPDGILYNTFLVVVIRMLVSIYGELDILNPFRLNNEDAFNFNLMKYGAKIEDIDNLKRLIDGFYIIEKRNKNAKSKEENNYFIEIQKVLIDLFNLKRINHGVTDQETKEFFDLLYTPGTSNPLRLSYNYLKSSNIYEIAEYYKEKMALNNDKDEENKKPLLKFDVYKLFKISVADLSKMNSDEINKINSDIYKAFDISENAMNKDYLLEEKLKQIKGQKKLLTSGNGYVDILLIMSIIITVVMVIFVFGTLYI